MIRVIAFIGMILCVVLASCATAQVTSVSNATATPAASPTPSPKPLEVVSKISDIDLSKIGHTVPSGRVQDLDNEPSDVVQKLVANEKESIPFLISKLEDNTRVNDRVFDYWYQTYVGDIALSVLGDLFTLPDGVTSTIPGMGWDELLERGSDRATMGEELLRRYIRKYGRKSIKAKWQAVWKANQDKIFWDSSERCFKLKP
jgi:hypothetical protein